MHHIITNLHPLRSHPVNSTQKKIDSGFLGNNGTVECRPGLPRPRIDLADQWTTELTRQVQYSS